MSPVGSRNLRTTCILAVALLGTAIPLRIHGLNGPVEAAHQAAGARPARAVTIVIQNFAFHPISTTVTLGTVVRWVNKDAVLHTSTYPAPALAPGSMSWNANINPGQTFALTTTARGVYKYDCTIHDMEGTLVVK